MEKKFHQHRRIVLYIDERMWFTFIWFVYKWAIIDYNRIDSFVSTRLHGNCLFWLCARFFLRCHLIRTDFHQRIESHQCHSHAIAKIVVNIAFSLSLLFLILPLLLFIQHTRRIHLIRVFIVILRVIRMWVITQNRCRRKISRFNPLFLRYSHFFCSLALPFIMVIDHRIESKHQIIFHFHWTKKKSISSERLVMVMRFHDSQKVPIHRTDSYYENFTEEEELREILLLTCNISYLWR